VPMLWRQKTSRSCTIDASTGATMSQPIAAAQSDPAEDAGATHHTHRPKKPRAMLSQMGAIMTLNIKFAQLIDELRKQGIGG
jgi:hypothetical protein